jgi:hypothetical protein
MIGNVIFNNRTVCDTVDETWNFEFIDQRIATLTRAAFHQLASGVSTHNIQGCAFKINFKTLQTIDLSMNETILKERIGLFMSLGILLLERTRLGFVNTHTDNLVADSKHRSMFTFQTMIQILRDIAEVSNVL